MKKLNIAFMTTSALIASLLSVPVYAADIKGTIPHALESLTSKDAALVTTYYKDLDQDNVKDEFDHCPNTLFGSKVDQHGCEMDEDGDGVVDRADRCPGTPKGARVNIFGCQNDEDGDGVYDDQDACPGTPRGVRVDARGCAIVTVDVDQDQVDDAQDVCTDTPPGTRVNGHGCEPVPMIFTNIIFESYSHEITPDQEEALKKDAAQLQDLQANEVVLITGHADWQGRGSMNLRLSWRRANSAKEYIIKELGHEADFVYINGRGELEPIADNKTEEGRQMNRRIEFKVIAREEIPNDATLVIPTEMLKR